MATITASGVGSNIDVNGIVSQLMSVERLPITELDTKEASYQTKLSAYASIKGALSSFQTAAFSLSSSSKFETFEAASSDTDVLTATTSSLAKAGSYAIQVDQIAQSQRLVSSGQTSLDADIGGGVLTFDIGEIQGASQSLQTALKADSTSTTYGGTGTNTLTFNFGSVTGGTYSGGQYSGSTFTSSSTASVSFTGPLSLDGLKSAINASGVPVTASVVEESGQYRLKLVSTETGAESSMEISVSQNGTVTNSLAGLLAQDYEGTQTLFQTVAAADPDLDASSGHYDSATTSFTSSTTRTVTIDSSTSSIQDIRDAINAAKIGVRAEVINDGSGTPYRLILSSESTGAASSMRISSTSTALQGFLGFDPTGTQNMAERASAQNAVFSVNGLEITKSSNTVNDVVRGVTMTLKEVGDTNLNITLDTDAVGQSVSNFVNAYNDLQKLVKDASYVDLATGERGILTGEGTVTSVMNQIRSVMNTAFNKLGATYTGLPQVGVSFKKDGTLELDSAKFQSALSTDYSAVTELFTYRRSASNPSDATVEGVAARLDKVIGSMMDDGGLLTGRTDGISTLIKNLVTRRDNLEQRMETVEARYRKQFAALDSLVGSMLQTSTYLTQQLASLNSSS